MASVDIVDINADVSASADISASADVNNVDMRPFYQTNQNEEIEATADKAFDDVTSAYVTIVLRGGLGLHSVPIYRMIDGKALVHFDMFYIRKRQRVSLMPARTVATLVDGTVIRDRLVMIPQGHVRLTWHEHERDSKSKDGDENA